MRSVFSASESTGRRALLLVFATVLTLACASAGEDLDALRRDLSGGRYVEPDDVFLRRVRSFFDRVLSGDAETDELAREANHLGLRVMEVRARGERLLVIAEREGKKRGGGIYAVRRRASLPLLLQAPHSFYDLHTGELAARFFEELPAAAVAWNSVHRGRSREARAASDLAHVEKSVFQTFLEAFAARHPQGAVLQFHGFSRGKRKTPAGERAGVILSNGTRKPRPSLIERRDALRALLEEPVEVYPIDVRELGGTTNVQGRWIRRESRLRFTHCEMSLGVRKRLRKDRELRARFGRRVVAGGAR